MRQRTMLNLTLLTLLELIADDEALSVAPFRMLLKMSFFSSVFCRFTEATSLTGG